MTSATIKLFLPHGDARRLRVCEVSNWTGKALAAPRTELEGLLNREETESSGVYFLLGHDAVNDAPVAYIGEAEVMRDRLRQHKSKDFWTSIIVFVSKDENLTKAHIRYLENRLIHEAKAIGRYSLENANINNPRLPESDREDMEVFLSRIRQVLPVLGSDLLTPIAGAVATTSAQPELISRVKNAIARGRRTETGFVVFAGSTAVLQNRPSAENRYREVLSTRHRLIEDQTLVLEEDHYRFTRDVEFTSPSAAAAVIHGGSVNGLTNWKDKDGRTLKEIEGA